MEQQPTPPCVQTLYEGEVRSRRDIDLIEDVIRDVRTTVMSRSISHGPRRCSLLETAAYMGLRLTLLRWASEFGGESSGGHHQSASCNIGSGISVRGSFGPGAGPPRVVVVLRHSDNDGSLPVAIPEGLPQPLVEDDDEIQEDPRTKRRPAASRKRGRQG